MQIRNVIVILLFLFAVPFAQDSAAEGLERVKDINEHTTECYPEPNSSLGHLLTLWTKTATSSVLSTYSILVGINS